MKTISILLALINSLAAGLVIAASAPSIQIMRPASSVGHALRVIVGLGVIAAGILTWTAACRATSRGLLFAAGLFLVALGTASTVWTIHVALTSGAVKDHMILYGLSLVTQGASSLWSLLTATRPGAVV